MFKNSGSGQLLAYTSGTAHSLQLPPPLDFHSAVSQARPMSVRTSSLVLLTSLWFVHNYMDYSSDRVSEIKFSALNVVMNALCKVLLTHTPYRSYIQYYRLTFPTGPIYVQSRQYTYPRGSIYNPPGITFLETFSELGYSSLQQQPSQCNRHGITCSHEHS
jgi:hypothetical protein